MNLLKWVIPWSHIVGEVISCTQRKRNRSIITLNYEPDFSSPSTDRLSKKLSLTTVHFFAEQLQMLPEDFFLEDSCLVEIWLVYQYLEYAHRYIPLSEKWLFKIMTYFWHLWRCHCQNSEAILWILIYYILRSSHGVKIPKKLFRMCSIRVNIVYIYWIQLQTKPRFVTKNFFV